MLFEANTLRHNCAMRPSFPYAPGESPFRVKGSIFRGCDALVQDLHRERIAAAEQQRHAGPLVDSGRQRFGRDDEAFSAEPHARKPARRAKAGAACRRRVTRPRISRLRVHRTPRSGQALT